MWRQKDFSVFLCMVCCGGGPILPNVWPPPFTNCFWAIKWELQCHDFHPSRWVQLVLGPNNSADLLWLSFSLPDSQQDVKRRVLGARGLTQTGYSPPWSALFLFFTHGHHHSRAGTHPPILLEEAVACANADTNAAEKNVKVFCLFVCLFLKLKKKKKKVAKLMLAIWDYDLFSGFLRKHLEEVELLQTLLNPLQRLSFACSSANFDSGERVKMKCRRRCYDLSIRYVYQRGLTLH